MAKASVLTKIYGDIVQLGERDTGSVEVGSSNLPVSTKAEEQTNHSVNRHPLPSIYKGWLPARMFEYRT